MDREKFMVMLKEIAELAIVQDKRMEKKDIEEYFSEMDLQEEHFELILAYLKENGKTSMDTASIEASELSDEIQEEDSKYLVMYREEIEEIEDLLEEEKKDLFIQLAVGKEQVKTRVIEGYLKKVVDIAKEYSDKGVLIEELIQEANLSLIGAVDYLCGNIEIEDKNLYLLETIRLSMIQLIDEEINEHDWEDTILGKTGLIHEATKLLSEELGRAANIHELSQYTRIPEEEIQDIVFLSVDTVKIGECHHHGEGEEEEDESEF